MPSVRSSILILACVFLGGCGAAATVFDPADLQAPSANRAIRLDQDYLYENHLGGINNVLAKITILAGRYQAEYQDAEGMYFRGPAGCFRTVYVDSTAPGLVADCGIYLPSAAGLAPRVYIEREPSPMQDTTSMDVANRSIPARAPIVPGALGAAAGATIVDAIVASDRGKPRFMGEKFQPGPALRAALKTE